MKFSNLIALILALHQAYGPVLEGDQSSFQEDCCGKALLSSGVSTFGFRVQRRDVHALYATIVVRSLHYLVYTVWRKNHSCVRACLCCHQCRYVVRC